MLNIVISSFSDTRFNEFLHLAKVSLLRQFSDLMSIKLRLKSTSFQLKAPSDERV